MAVVHIPALLAHLTGGQRRIEVAGSSVRQLIENLEEAYPGIRAQLVEGGRLRPSVSVAIDGEVCPLGLLEKVEESSEVHFLANIRGGF